MKNGQALLGTVTTSEHTADTEWLNGLNTCCDVQWNTVKDAYDIPVKLYTNLQNDGVDAVYTLLWILLLVTLPLPVVCFILSRKTPTE